MKELLKLLLVPFLISAAIVTITILVLYFGFGIIPTPLQSSIFGGVVGFIAFFVYALLKKP